MLTTLGAVNVTGTSAPVKRADLTRAPQTRGPFPAGTRPRRQAEAPAEGGPGTGGPRTGSGCEPPASPSYLPAAQARPSRHVPRR